jgi:two-component system, cell cycle response regulator
MNGGRPVRVILLALLGWAVLREAEVGPLRSALHGPAFGKLAYWIVVVGASLLTIARARSIRGREGLAWGLIGLGSLLWASADVYWTVVLSKHEVIPVPSISDAGYLAFYPLVFAGLCLLLRARVEGTPRTLWVDGITAALAAGALSAAIVLQTVLDTVGGDALGVATNLAYPFGDLILLSVVIASFALRGWRADRTWLLLGLGIVLFWVADSYYLVTVANETYTYPSVMDGGWTSCLILLSVAAWQRPRRAVVDDQRGLRFTALPIAFATLGLAILVVAALNGLNAVAVLLAAASLLAVFGRLILTLRENAGMLASSRHEALTDALTGLGNRRALSRDLERAVADERDAVLLALFDLDGFKHYNDSYGHPAGDALLQRLGTKLAAHVDGVGTAYRMGGDEFCVLLPARGDGAEQAAAAAWALAEHGDGFTITCSHGAVDVPAEADEPGEALRIADQRMYAHKNGGRSSARSQSRDVLLRALAERDPDLGEHISGVAALAEAVARRLNLDDEQIDHIRHAAELHDVGKMAIPDAILDKPAPLEPAEWEFIRRHTLIGERIVAAAPALRPVAALVRSSHERWDGTGYPDQLAGEEIPLGARIVAVCDAFDAMIADRPYRLGVDAVLALGELGRCAGTQFDPAVVAAFTAAFYDRAELGDAA